MKRRIQLSVLALVATLLALPLGSASADGPTASVSIAANKTSYVAGETATFNVTIVATNLNYVFQIQFPNQTTWATLNFDFPVHENTVAIEHVAQYYNYKVRAALYEDTKGTPNDLSDDTLRAEQIKSVSVRMAIRTVPQSYYTSSGGTAVFARGSAPKFRSLPTPATPGYRCLRHQVQRKYSSGWRTVKTSGCVVEGKQGRVDWRWTGRHPSRVLFRVRGVFAGDAVNASSTGTWLRFRFR